MTARAARWSSVVLLIMLLLLCRWQGWLVLSLYESLGVVTGYLSVLLAIEQRIINFPVGITSCVFLAIVFLVSKPPLYGSMIVQLVYLGLGVQGWYLWARGGGEQQPLRISRMPFHEGLLLAIIAVPVMAIFAWYLRYIGSGAPILDAVANTLSLCAQYLMNRKRLEIWPVGIVADLLYITLYVSQGFYLIAGLYVFYLALCIAGYLAWSREYRAQESAPSPAPLTPVS